MNALKAQGQLTTKTPDGRVVLLPEAARIIAGAKQARNDAQMPMQAAIRGEGAPRAQFIRGNARGIGREALVERLGADRGNLAADVEQRFEQGERARQAKAARKTDPIAVEQRRRDAENKAVADRGRMNAEDIEIGKLVQLMQRGRQFDAPDEWVADGPGKARRVAGAKAGQSPLRVPGRDAFIADSDPAAQPAVRCIKLKNGQVAEIQVGKPNFRRPTQPTREAPVAPSIAPDPGVITGNQPAPAVDAGRGGPMPDDMRAELNRLTPKSKVAGFLTEPDGVTTGARDRREVIKRIERQNLRRRTGGIAALGAGGAAGLAGMLGTGGNEEEEQMYR